ncbi:MAG: hypothetical protein ABI036_12650 [Fibrobacteria bacterium]
MNSIPKYLLLAAAASSLIGLTGCLFGSDNSGPSEENVSKSENSSQLATANLESNIERMRDLDQFRYGEEDLTDLRASHSQFAEAVALNPGNNKAHLGMAITGILLAGQSEKLASVINQTVDSRSPFDTRLTEDTPLLRVSALRKVAAASTLPEFHVIQDAIADTLLPALEDAMVHLKTVYDDPSFSMILTNEGESRELDHAEAGILLAGAHAIHSLLTLWLSRDIDIDHNGSYDYLESFGGLDTISDFSQLSQKQKEDFNKAAEILGPTSSFLTVRPAWSARLGAIDGEIKSALAILKESIASIDMETDPQGNDLIHICAMVDEGPCIDRSAYTDGKAVIDTAIKYMSQPYALHLPDIDTTILIDFSAYFNVQDYKQMLPYYGFYNANEWSDEKPVLYFTNASHQITGNIKTLTKIVEDADSLGTPASEVVAQFRSVIHFQDPTFQGFLPNATEAGIWNLILKQAEYEENRDSDPGLILEKRTVSAFKPDFALSLIGK